MYEDEVLPIWKGVGESTHQITLSISEKTGVKCAHTGILDPLASGVIIVLVGEARYQRQTYTQTPKEYIGQVTLGIKTDSLDILGIPQELDPDLYLDIERDDLSPMRDDPSLKSSSRPLQSQKKEIENQLNITRELLIGEIEQEPPAISNIKHKKKRAQYWAKRQTLKESLPLRRVRVDELELLGVEWVDLQSLISFACVEIPKAQGYFRQAQILEVWRSLRSKKINHQLIQFRFRARVGAGCYIRSLARDWIEKSELGFGVLSLLTRTENAGFRHSDCVSI